jgi:hypothetical protein
VLHVAVAANADAGIKDLPLVGHSILVGVAVLDDVVGVGLVGEDAVVVDRQDHAWKQHLIHEHGVAIVGAVAL